MQNDFEKQVQQKMEELDFAPSEPVWTNIEKEIRKKDKRRYFIWLPVLLLLAGGGLYWNYSMKKSVQEGSGQRQISKIKYPSNHTTSTNIKEKDQVLEKETNSSVTSNINPDKINIDKPIQKTSINSNTIKIDQRSRKNLFGGKKSGLLKEAGDPAILMKNDIDRSYKESSLQIESNIIDRFSLEHLFNKPQFNLIFDAIERRIVNENIEKEKKIVVNKKHHWIIGVEASIGTSNQTSGHGSMDKSYAAGAPATYPSNQMIQSPYTHSLSYSAGIILKRKLNKSIEFQTGITYQYLSFNVLVGQHVRNDTVVNAFSLNQFYRNTAFTNSQPTTLSNYENQLHFISIPLKLAFQPFTKVPFTLSAGILLQQLIHSNMLVYDPNSGVYYNSNKSLNKFLISSTAGIEYSFPLLKHRISVGPYINYGLSNTIKNMPGYLSNVNFRASMDIKKISKKQRF
jgi:hypothetical protein